MIEHTSPRQNTPMVTFKVHDIFHLQSRGWYIVSGQVLEGECVPGQVGYFTHRPDLMCRIHAMEFIRHSHRELPALIFLGVSDEHARLLLSLKPGALFLSSTARADIPESPNH